MARVRRVENQNLVVLAGSVASAQHVVNTQVINEDVRLAAAHLSSQSI